MRINEISREYTGAINEGTLWNRVKSLAGGLSRDPSFANADYNTRLKILANNSTLDTITQQVFSTWQARHSQLTKTKGGALTPLEAQQQVTALVKQSLLPPYTELDNLVNGQAIDQSIRDFVDQYNRRDMASAEKTMGRIAELGAAAITTRQAKGATATPQSSAQTATQAPAPGEQPAATTTGPATDDLRREVFQTLTGLGVTNIPQRVNAMRQAMGGLGANLSPQSTGDAYADSLLRLFGFDPR
jgi:hypothetical protein